MASIWHVYLTVHFAVILVLSRPSKATEEQLHFRNVNLNDVVFVQNILFQSKARSKLSCSYQCSGHSDCLTFTFNGGSHAGSCRGHSSVMTLQHQWAPYSGAKTFVLTAASNTERIRRISTTDDTTSMSTTTSTSVGTTTSPSDGTTTIPSDGTTTIPSEDSTTTLPSDGTTSLSAGTAASASVSTVTSVPAPITAKTSTDSSASTVTDAATSGQPVADATCPSEPPAVTGALLVDWNTTHATYQCTGILTNGPASVACLPSESWDSPAFACDDCAATEEANFFGNTGTLLSPGYPGAYSPSFECEYIVTLEQAGPQTVTVDVEKNLEDHSRCLYDYIRFNSGDKLCGSDPVSLTFDVSGTTWTMKFKTDRQTEKPLGFRVTYYVTV